MYQFDIFFIFSLLKKDNLEVPGEGVSCILSLQCILFVYTKTRADSTLCTSYILLPCLLQILWNFSAVRPLWLATRL